MSVSGVQEMIPLINNPIYILDSEYVKPYTYPHKAPKNIKWPSAITMFTAHVTCGLMFDLVIADVAESKLHDTKCLSCNQVSLKIEKEKI